MRLCAGEAGRCRETSERESDGVGELKTVGRWGSQEGKAHKQGCLGRKNRDSQGWRLKRQILPSSNPAWGMRILKLILCLAEIQV